MKIFKQKDNKNELEKFERNIRLITLLEIEGNLPSEFNKEETDYEKGFNNAVQIIRKRIHNEYLKEREK